MQTIDCKKQNHQTFNSENQTQTKCFLPSPKIYQLIYHNNI